MLIYVYEFHKWTMFRLINDFKTWYTPIKTQFHTVQKFSDFFSLQENAYFCWSFMAKLGVCPWKTCWVVTDSPIMFHSFRQHNRMGLLTAPGPLHQHRAEKQLNTKTTTLLMNHIFVVFSFILDSSADNWTLVDANSNKLAQMDTHG